jgi:hypothetical protein
MATTLTGANTAAAAARASGQTTLDPQVLATIRNHYRGALALGIHTSSARAGPHHRLVRPEPPASFGEHCRLWSEELAVQNQPVTKPDKDQIQQSQPDAPRSCLPLKSAINAGQSHSARFWTPQALSAVPVSR